MGQGEKGEMSLREGGGKGKMKGVERAGSKGRGGVWPPNQRATSAMQWLRIVSTCKFIHLSCFDPCEATFITEIEI